MKLLFPILILAIAALPVSIAAGGGNAQSGQAVFDKSCKMCHGPQGQGNPGIAKALNVTIPELGSKEVQAKSDAELKQVVLEGKGKMKPMKTVSAGEVDDAIAFVRTLAKK